MLKNLIDATDDELASALHELDGHSDGFEGSEARAWQTVRAMVLRVVEQQRELAAEVASEQADVNA